MALAENVLFKLAKCLYRTEIAHTGEQKNALKHIDLYDSYRAKEVNRVMAAVKAQGIDIFDKTVIDMGCSDGAISRRYIEWGAAKVIGIDINDKMIERARAIYSDPHLEFLLSKPFSMPLEDRCADLLISYDVFEHVSQPALMTREIFRVLRSGGKALIGTWGWYHPFAPHLWSTMPVPWAHVVFSEATVLSVCQRVYHSSWYSPNMHDYDEHGKRLTDKYMHRSISTDYLNKFLIRDFERVFQDEGFYVVTRPIPFGSSYANWNKVFLKIPWIREFITAYAWFVLTKPLTFA
jgi:SAM-dependent methyltransferase